MPATLTRPETQQAQQLLSRARAGLLMHHPWFGSLALRLKVVEEPGIGLAATDGTHFFYDAGQVVEVGGRESRTLEMLWAHEVLHCALLHMFRRGHRNHLLWNVACDHVINLQLEANGFVFPKSGPWQGLRERRFAGLNAEQVYEILVKEGALERLEEMQSAVRDLLDPPKAGDDEGQGQGQGGEGDKPGQGKGQGKGCPKPMTVDDWAVATEQATMLCRKAGTLPAGMERLIGEAREPRVDWRSVLREFVTDAVVSDYSWARPNRRHVANGLYLPGVHKESTAWGVAVIDTSGSMTQRMLEQVAGELTAVMADARPERLVVYYCDAKVHGDAVVFTPDGGPIDLEMRGGGGTLAQPAFDAVEEMIEETGEPPNFLIYLTDLYLGDVPREPEYPVLWATTLSSSGEAPFGTLVRCDVDYD